MDREVDYERKTEFFFIINLFILDKILRISLNVDALDLRIWNRNFLSTYSPWNLTKLFDLFFSFIYREYLTCNLNYIFFRNL